MFQHSIVSFVTLVALGVCGAVPKPAGPSASPSAAVQQRIPSEAPSITGVITQLDRGRRVRVEDSETNKKAVVRITDATRILDRKGEATSEAALALGQTVRVWFVGPVAESFPVQATAGVLVIDQ